MSDFPFHLAIGLLILWALYITPTVIAFRRGHPNRWVIAILNVVFGATLLGWLAALVWSLQAVHLTNMFGGSDGGESGLNLFVNDQELVRDPSQASRSEINPVMPDDDAIDIRAAAAELDRLKTLRDIGELSQQQYDTLKSVLLRRVV